MSKIQSRSAWSLATLAVAVAVSGAAQAGKPMNVVEKKQAADAMARAYFAQQAAPARKGKATATPQLMPKGGTGAEVPDDLHNYLHAQVDASGKVRIVETDGPAAPAQHKEEEL